MKKKSLNRLSAFFNILLVVLLLFPNFVVSASVFAVDTVFPSTNEINKTKGWAQVNELNKLPGSTKFELKSTRSFRSCFEYRTDGDTSQIITENDGKNYNTLVIDGLYPYECVNNSTNELTISANEFVEIRLTFGAESDERFAWTRFDVLPVPVPPSVPVLEYPVDNIAINDNTPLMQWSDSTDSDGTISHYLYRVFYNCTNMENIPGSCSVFPNLTGLRLNESQYQAGTTNDNTYYWQVRAVDNDGNLSEWSKLGAFTVDTTNPNTTLVPPEGLTGNTFAVSGEAEDNISLNRVYVQLVHKQTSQRYGGTTIYLSGTKQDWSQTFDATKLGMPEGDYAAHVAVVDNAGNTSSVGWSEYFQVDKTPPVITISSPLNNEVLRTPERKLKVFGSISDNIATNYIHIQIVDSKGNSRGVYTVHGTKSEELLVELDVKDLQDGEYKIYYWGVDRVGNVSERPYITILLDNTAPVAPTGLYWYDVDNNKQINCGGYSNTHHVKEHWGAIEGDNSFKHYEYSSFNAPNGSAGLVEKIFDTNFFDSSWWEIPLEGTYGFQVRSVDSVGNKSGWALGDTVGIGNACTITIDWTAPVAPTLTSPSNDSFVKGDLLESKWEKIDDAHNYIYESYHDAEAKNLRYHQEYATNSKSATNVSESTFWWRVKAVDAAGNASDWSELWKVTVDNTPPKGEIMGIRYEKADSTNFITNDKTPLLYGTCSDNYGVDKVEVVIGETTLTSTCNEGNWTTELPELPDGDHEITLKITDKAGNTTEVKGDITIDSVAPKATYTHYIDGEQFEGDAASVKHLNQLSFTGVYTDDNPSSRLKYDSYVIFQAQDDGTFKFSANGKKSYCSWRTSPNLIDLTTYDSENKIPFTNCITTLPDGEYYMAHQVYDNAVRSDIPSIFQFRDVLGLHFFIKNTPTVTITTPYTEVEQGTANFTVSASAIDGNGTLKYNWTGSNGFTSKEDSFLFQPTLAGTYIYTIKVTDEDGDFDEKSVTITVKAPPASPETDTPDVLGTINTVNRVPSTSNPRSSGILRASTQGTGTDEESLTTIQEEIDTSEVLAVETVSCEVKKTVTGYIYVDKNKNNIKDGDEKAFENIKVKISTKENGNEKIIEELKTDRNGEWKTTMCPGRYYVSIESTDIPDGYKLDGEAIAEINVLENDSDAIEQVFLLLETKTFIQKYWWVFLLATLLLAGIVVSRSRKENQH